MLWETPEVAVKLAVTMWSPPSSGITHGADVPPAQSSVQMSSCQFFAGFAFSVTLPVPLKAM